MTIETRSAPGVLCRRRDTCRLCGSSALEMVIRLTPTPPANAFVGPAERSIDQARFPLELMLCSACSHAQLGHVVDPQLLFARYPYVSGTSPVFVEHFRQYAEDVVRSFSVPRDSLVVDIGSNDGTLLRWFQTHDLRVLGIDPAVDIAMEATDSGIETIPSFVTRDLAQAVRQERGAASVVTANNVFAHIDDLASATRAVAELLAPDGLFVFEVSYFPDVCERNLFDTIYHEHLDYHTLVPLARFFAEHGLDLMDASRVTTHGGSVRGVAQLRDGKRAHTDRLSALIRHERTIGLDKPATLRAFAARIERAKEEVTGLLRHLRGEGRSIAGYGAPAKATTLMYHFELGPEILDFIVDDSPRKQGLFTPGLHVPVLPVEALYERRPDDVLILAWNFADSIRAAHRAFVDQGGRMIIPLPSLEIVAR